MAMAVSAQLVNLSAKAELKLVEAVAKAMPSGQAQFSKACTALITNANAPDLIRKVLEQRNVILEMSKTDDVEGCFGILFSLLFKTDNPKAAVPALSMEIATKVLEKVDDRAPLRLKLVTNLYNMLPVRTAGQLEVLLLVIRYAKEAKLVAMLSSFFAGVDDWIKGWELSVADQRRLYLLISDTLGSEGKAVESQKFLMKYLATYDGATTAELAEVKAAAVRGCIGAVKSPIVSFTEQHNLLGMAAVAQLKADPKYSAVHELLHIFSVEKLGEYMAFHEKNAKTLADNKIDHDSCVSSMRLLSLCSLATEHEEIPYQVVADTLQVSGDDEVEDWVLQAIQTGLMEAKMDQMQRVVVIRRCTNRVFGPAQWKTLQMKLGTWSANVQTLLSAIQKSNERYQQQSFMKGD
ncbi:unnamed protein product [Ectocarpus sp. 6 AP-2014]